MLTRKALIVHCLTSPPSARLCVFWTHSGAKEKGFGLAYDTQLASGKTEIFKHISKMFPRQKGRKCFFVVAFCGVFVVVMTTWPVPPAKCWPAWKSNYFDCIQSPCEDWAVWT